MQLYTKAHAHYCGSDLHARTMYLCILDGDGEILLHKNIKSNPKAFLQAVEPYREDLVVAVECVFTGYWLADVCRKQGIEFVLGHALSMKAIHGAKAKNDKLDALKIACLLRGGNLPIAYVYPPEMRATRDLLRRRLHLVRRRANLLGHIRNTHHQYNLPEPQAKLVYKANRQGVAEVFPDRDVRKSMELDFALIEQYDDAIRDVQLHAFAESQGARSPDLLPAAVRPRDRKDPGAHHPLRDPRHPPVPNRPGLPFLRPAGQVRPVLGKTL